MDSTKGETKDADVKCEADTKEENTEKNTCPNQKSSTSSDVKPQKSSVDVSMFGESSGMADAVLLVEETPIPVIKAVLGVASPVFRAMFERDFKEKGNNEITLPGKKLSAVVLLLECIYPDILRTVTEDVAFVLIPLAEEYQIPKLKAMGEKVLVVALRHQFEEFYLKDCTFLYAYLFLAASYHLTELCEYCVSLAADFKQGEREKAMLKYKIPNATIMKIDKLVIYRHEIFREDVDVYMNHLTTRYEYKPKAFFYETESMSKKEKYLSEFVKAELQKDVKDILRGLRLTYIYGDGYALKKSAILQIRKIQGFSGSQSFKLLPENIKRDIEGVFVEKFD